jgi:hypothetical protein
LQADAGQHGVEQLAGLADEGFALAVLVAPRRLADEEPFGGAVADTRHALRAAGGEGTAGTGAHRRYEFFPVQPGDVIRRRRCMGDRRGGARLGGGRDFRRRRAPQPPQRPQAQLAQARLAAEPCAHGTTLLSLRDILPGGGVAPPSDGRAGALTGPAS